MLVLSRKEGERIVIGDNITLVVTKVSGNRVTIGIEAPKDVKVVREELTDGHVPSEASFGTVPGKSPRPTTPRPTTLREFAASVLPMHRQVG